MKKNYIGLFIFVLLIAGCKENSQSPQSADVIMPLAVGNQWYWDVEYYAPDGTVTGAGKDSLLITSTRNVGGVERYVIGTGAEIYYEGSALVTSLNGFRKPFIWARHPMPLAAPEIIDTFVITTEQSPDPIENAEYIMTYLSNSVPITTPSGNYNTLKYQFDLIGMRSDTLHSRDFGYYALNVGLVMKEQFVLDTLTGNLYRVSQSRLTKVILN
jgi:hypothetical protein